MFKTFIAMDQEDIGNNWNIREEGDILDQLLEPLGNQNTSRNIDRFNKSNTMEGVGWKQLEGRPIKY